jgi:hypothetical protein
MARGVTRVLLKPYYGLSLFLMGVLIFAPFAGHLKTRKLLSLCTTEYENADLPSINLPATQGFTTIGYVLALGHINHLGWGLRYDDELELFFRTEIVLEPGILQMAGNRLKMRITEEKAESLRLAHRPDVVTRVARLENYARELVVAKRRTLAYHLSQLSSPDEAIRLKSIRTLWGALKDPEIAVLAATLLVQQLQTAHPQLRSELLKEWPHIWYYCKWALSLPAEEADKNSLKESFEKMDQTFGAVHPMSDSRIGAEDAAASPAPNRIAKSSTTGEELLIVFLTDSRVEIISPATGKPVSEVEKSRFAKESPEFLDFGGGRLTFSNTLMGPKINYGPRYRYP